MWSGIVADGQNEVDNLNVKTSEIQYIRPTKLACTPKLQGTFSTIEELPNETIVEIFLYCVLGQTSITKSADLSLTPLNLSYVSSRWRQIALSTPDLWNDIRIVYTSSQVLDWAILTRKLEIFLHRAERSLISLEIVVYGLQSSSLCKPVKKLLTRYSDRFRHISINPAEYLVHMYDLHPGSLNSLESVSLNYANIAFYNDITLSSAAPKLREVTIHSSSIYHPLSENFQLPWALTNLNLSNIILPYVIGHAILQRCRNLVSCTFSIDRDAETLPSLPDTVMSHLSLLSVKAPFDQGKYGNFFRPLVTPSLKVFKLYSGGGVDWSEGELASFISRSSCNVERFITSASGKDILELLQRMPSLVHLNHILPLDSTIIWEIAEGHLFPMLETLECGVPSILSEIVSMLQRRSLRWDIPKDPSSNRTLKSVAFSLYNTTTVDGSSIASLAELAAHGLQLNVKDLRQKD